MREKNKKGKAYNATDVRHMLEGVVQGITIRAVAKELNCSPATVSSARRKLEAAEISSLAALSALSDQAILDLYYGQGRAIQCSHDVIITRQNRRTVSSCGNGLTILKPDYERYASMVIDEHVQKKLTFTLYLKECFSLKRQSICRTSFMEGLNRIIREQIGPDNVYMRQYHEYGDEVAIDYCGDVFELSDASGTKKKYAICVLTWAASNYVYAEFIPRQTTIDTCNVISHAIMRWQCMPRILVCDNAKSLVTMHATGQEPIFNESFIHHMHKIGIYAKANNPYSPSSKSYVELSVRLVQDRVLPLLKRRSVPLYLAEANNELIKLVDTEINNTGFRNNGTGVSRRTLFEEHEIKAALKPTNAIPEFREYINNIRSGRDYTVLIKEHRYSVPWHHANEILQAELSSTRVYIIGSEGVIAEHQRDDCSGVSMLPEHMKPEHRAVFEKRTNFKNIDQIIEVAALISPVLRDFCQNFFKSHTIEQVDCPITIIRRFRKHPDEQKIYIQALRRVMETDVKSWTSYAFDKTVKAIKKEQETSGTANKVTPDQSQCCLHGAKAFTSTKSPNCAEEQQNITDTNH